ncbi:MAG: bifunctional hydroxymethylpyrimidine kinase/phosphomethylpyrimidine kinase [Magnetococcales bacterium]|nr:bifunctional hydroxymethylpyrimidine kinase/phosphomethylpyrimidine kinase [Magnetococcales bacterium]
MSRRGRVLIIAGSDPIAGAGLQADLKTVTALGGYGMTAVTAITVQDSAQLFQVVPMTADLVMAQAQACLKDVGADCIKLGMLATTDIVLAVADLLRHYPSIPVVADPVLRSSDGSLLLDETAQSPLYHQLLPHVTLLTPNIPEAEQLTGRTITPANSQTDKEQAARQLAQQGPMVLLKGGHLAEDPVTDLWFDHRQLIWLRAPRQAVAAGFHGTGCTLAAAIAAGIACGHTATTAVRLAHATVQMAMADAVDWGRGQRLLRVTANAVEPCAPTRSNPTHPRP